RVRNGIAVQIYIDIAGSSQDRAATVQKFYELGKQRETTRFSYPNVNPAVMGTNGDLVHYPFTVPCVIEEIKTFIEKHGNLLVERTLTDNEISLFHKRYEQMERRNEKIARPPIQKREGESL